MCRIKDKKYKEQAKIGQKKTIENNAVLKYDEQGITCKKQNNRQKLEQHL